MQTKAFSTPMLYFKILIIFQAYLKKLMYLFLAVLGHHCCAGFSLVEALGGGYSPVWVPGLLIEVASLVQKGL